MIGKSKVAWFKASSVILLLGLLLQSYAYINRDPHKTKLVVLHTKVEPGFVRAMALRLQTAPYASHDVAFHQKINELVFTLLWLSVMVVVCFGFVRR